MRFAFDTEDDRKWASQLPAAWSTATRGRSQIRIVDRDADFTIYFFNESGVSGANVGNPWVAVYGKNYGEPVNELVFVHEIGHFLGCCFGPGTRSGHFIDGEISLMSDPRCRECSMFTERELAQMGLLP